MSTTTTKTRRRAAKRTVLPRKRTGNIYGNTDAVFDYWLERLQTSERELDELGRRHEWIEKNSMSYRGDELRHYGHWTLAEGIRDGRGRTRMVLVNGDRYFGGGSFGNSTAMRTVQAGHTARRTGEGFPTLNVPFSALRVAGIERSSIRILEALDESWSVTLRRVPASVVEQDLATPLAQHSWARYRAEEDGTITMRDERAGYAADVRWTLERDGSDYLVPQFRHWLGEALFSAVVIASQGTRHYRRRAKFLSAFDHNEAGVIYFLAELPRTEAQTVEEAFDALAPIEVKQALAAGLAVERQGDIFAIPTSLTTRELKARARKQTITRYEHTGDEVQTHGIMYNRATHEYEQGELHRPVTQPIWERVEHEVSSTRMRELLGTNHVATEQILTTDGDTYARGFLRHRPPNRQADHHMVKLGDAKTWYRIMRNTVPLATTTTTRSGRFDVVRQSGSSRAWTLGGQVD